MTEDKAFKSMGELIHMLAAAEDDLEKGVLRLEGLDKACDDARELYERLVVLRHRAREGRQTIDAPGTVADPIRLDTKPAISPGQTSLIDAIADSERTGNRTTQKRGKRSGPAIRNEAMARVLDLSKAISLNHKFWFVAEFFKGDRSAFDRAVSTKNEMEKKQDALAYLENEVLAALDKPPDQEALDSFKELLDRRFP